MKKRNVMTMALSLAMVGVIAVGGTLAYLTAQDGAVTNTFTFVTGDSGKDVINVDLTEEKPEPVANEKILTGHRESGWNYTDVTPGQDLNKAPVVTVDTKVDAYVFIRLTQGNVTIKNLDTTNWIKLEGVEGVSNVYYQEVAANGNVKGTSLFTKVTAPNVADTEGVRLDNVVIEVAAIQAASFADAKAAYEAGVTEAGNNADNFFQGTNAD